MNCDDIGQLTPLYLSGELDPGRSAELRAHLELCGSCAREIQQQRELDRRLRAEVLAESVDTQQLEQAVRRQIAIRPGTKVTHWLVAAASIAAVATGSQVAYRTWYQLNPPPVCVDAALDHYREIVDRQPRPWLSDAAAIESLAKRQGVPASAVAALGPTAYHLERGRLCFLDKRIFLHLVYTKDGQEFSVYLRPRDSQSLSGETRGTINGKQVYAADLDAERVAFFQTDRLTAVFVAEQSSDSALSLARAAATRL
jgi:anti-sigma factor RsiW